MRKATAELFKDVKEKILNIVKWTTPTYQNSYKIMPTCQVNMEELNQHTAVVTYLPDDAHTENAIKMGP